ncbi:unnamed protein product [Gongylonema pulchrum]|uniref:G_PROTEIN_RECEP_F1_2 domain-containing protein n=1 Tax=Gongylonema pulchrum TaxID=637853 RepID=A0A183DQC7_9BILA|nr:unnamed protein product [Gongylonema pulchrum]
MIPLIILGIFGNINIIIATAHQRNLHSHNTMLIAIIAVFDLAYILLRTCSNVETVICEAHSLTKTLAPSC